MGFTQQQLDKIIKTMVEIEQVTPRDLIRCTISQTGAILYKENPESLDPHLIVGDVRFYEGIERPLFRWGGIFLKYQKQYMTTRFDKEVPNYRLFSSRASDNPIFELIGEKVDRPVLEFLIGIFTADDNDPRKIIRENAGAVLYSPEKFNTDQPPSWIYADWVLIEFYRHEGAQAFMDYVNEHCPVGHR